MFSCIGCLSHKNAKQSNKKNPSQTVCFVGMISSLKTHRFISRYAISQYVDRVGDIVSHLNITNVRVEDGGLYSCRASNSLGSSEHSARLNIYGMFYS